MAEVNITCRHCRHRHPASRSCAEAKRLADIAAEKWRRARVPEPEVDPELRENCRLTMYGHMTEQQLFKWLEARLTEPRDSW